MPVTIHDSVVELSRDPRDGTAPLAPAGEEELAARSRLLPGARLPFYGVYPAVVHDVEDPDNQGRVQVRLPWALDPDDGEFIAWARLATLLAGANRGTWFVPEVDDEVLVAFEAGNPERPYVVGALWNGVDGPPATGMGFDAGTTLDPDSRVSHDSKTDHGLKVKHDPKVGMIRSRSGVVVRFEGDSGSEKLTLSTPGGQKIVLDNQDRKVSVADGNGNEVELRTDGVVVNASAKVEVSCTTVEISAAHVSVEAGMSQFSGVVKCDTLITNNVISTNYSPGA